MELIYRDGEDLAILNPDRIDEFFTVLEYGVVPGTGIIQMNMSNGAQYQLSFYDSKIPFDANKVKEVKIEFDGKVTIRLID
ncbi:hypothetical protein OAK35_04245 [Crocinitomicaceae bacterium]|nr:hypothetical protein [Crocinitomicaceae bacterium]